MTTLYFVRHCESEMNRQPQLVGGRSNHTPATEQGRRQAALLGTYLKKAELIPDHIYSSPAVRTATTAQIALEAAGISLPVYYDDRLQELGQGEFEGRDRQTVYTPENIAAYRLSELDGTLPGGESIADAQMRMSDFLFDMHEQHPDATLLVFGHGLAIRALAGKIRNQTKQEILAACTDNVSLSCITVENATPHVAYVGKNVISE